MKSSLTFAQLRAPFAALMLGALVAACGGGGGRDPVLGFDSSSSSGTSNSSTTVAALGSAASFGIFGGGAGITNQGTITVVRGAQGQPVSIGTTGASQTVTGFHDTSQPYTPPAPASGCTYTETTLNVGEVQGTILTDAGTSQPTLSCPTGGTASTKALADQGALDALAAFNDLAGRPGATDPGANLGGLTLAPGVYATSSGAFLITGSDLTLDAGGNANAVWVFQMASSLTVGDTAPRSIILAGGAQPKNIFWQVGSSATINNAGGGTMVGTIISSATTTISNPANSTSPTPTTLNGRALALNAAVTVVNTVINVPAP